MNKTFFLIFIQGTTYLQIDKYSRKRTEEINEAVGDSIKKIVADTQEQQQKLLAEANTRTTGKFYSFLCLSYFDTFFISFFFEEVENEFQNRLQDYIAKLDSEKATVLVQLEKDLDHRQQLILETARKRIDDLNTEANRLKMVSLFSTFLFFYFNTFSSF